MARTIACYNTTTLNVPLNDMLIAVLGNVVKRERTLGLSRFDILDKKQQTQITPESYVWVRHYSQTEISLAHCLDEGGDKVCLSMATSEVEVGFKNNKRP